MNTLCICSKNEIYKIFQRKKVLDYSDCHIGNYGMRSINRVNFKQYCFIFFTELSLCNSFPYAVMYLSPLQR